MRISRACMGGLVISRACMGRMMVSRACMYVFMCVCMYMDSVCVGMYMGYSPQVRLPRVYHVQGLIMHVCVYACMYLALSR
jgi:hypothetical protein